MHDIFLIEFFLTCHKFSGVVIPNNIMKKSLLVNGLLASWLTCTVSGLIPLEIKGSRFVKPSTNSSDPGQEFIVVGIDYQPGGSSAFNPGGNSDVLTDADACLRDGYLLQQLGVNAIRVYSVNPWLNHDECMSIFNGVGIYVVIDVNNPFSALSRTDPASSYNQGYLNNVFGVIDAFKDYPNVLGFLSGNEVVNDATSAAVCPPYIRAVQRDMKQYIAKHSSRAIPVGYSAADDITLRLATWEYLQCGDDISKSDFYGLNSYEWCSGTNDWQTSGYGLLESSFNSTSIPVFLSEYGCNKNSPRTFDEVYQGIYAQLDDVFSGGLVYEYSQETSNYGLVNLDDNGDAQILQDYVNLQAAYNKIKLPTTSADDISNGTAASECSASSISSIDNGFSTNFTLPPCPAPDMLENGGGNTNIGKIVNITSILTTHKILDLNGNQLENTSITINADDQINAPSGSSITNDPVEKNSSAAATTTKHKGGASKPEAVSGLVSALLALVFMAL
jgi:hypothetical protein